MIIGTAGHIDHGKTALVKALTGVDTDRLKEEKARGITIDLGFAYLPNDGGDVIGFVDVPGHERFVHTMLAGATGIDFALLTIAADDGVKPQTLEHLAIVDLLGIRRGLVALTKVDVASPERLAAVINEIRAVLAGTTLESAEIYPVSSLTGQGVSGLRHRLFAAAADMFQRPVSDRFRLAIDRSFTLSGAGVVVTGTVLSGSVRLGDRVLISPSGLSARVRSIHTQNRPANEGRAGDRCALNLAGEDVSKEAIRRGDLALDPDLHAPTDRIDASLRVLQGGRKPIGQWFPVRLHHAAAEVGARVVLLDDLPIEPGGTATVQLVLDRPIAAGIGDRYVIRDVSAQRTIGGGRFLDLRAPARRRRTPERRLQLEALALTDPAMSLQALLAAAPYIFDWRVFTRDHALSQADAAALADRLRLILLEAGDTVIAMLPARWRVFESTLMEQLSLFHGENPDLQGMSRERLRLSLQPRLPGAAFISAMKIIAGDGAIALDGAFVRLSSHTVRLTQQDEVIWEAIFPLLDGPDRFRPPRVRDIASLLDRPEADIRRLLKLVGRLGRADEVAHDHFFLRLTILEIVSILVDVAMRAPGGEFTAAQFRDRVENGRKVAIQILDFFDRHGVTLRRGDLRRLNKHRLDLFGPFEIGSQLPDPKGV
ncbi:MAG: Selenocysteine-specific translation elongation factor [Rhodospirillales bacterium]|nr:Selenocysteine-specific translation elongation factor [Rhodospirillales bacterium]